MALPDIGDIVHYYQAEEVSRYEGPWAAMVIWHNEGEALTLRVFLPDGRALRMPFVEREYELEARLARGMRKGTLFSPQRERCFWVPRKAHDDSR